MFEICALLAKKKAPKARKPSKPAIKIGAKCFAYGHAGVVVSRHDTHANWWNVEIEGRGISGFDRSIIDIVKE